MKKQNATRTRNIATDNIVKMAQSDLVTYAKKCEAAGLSTSGHEPIAFSAGNRQTVVAVEYSPLTDFDNRVHLVPTYICWTFELDALNQSERIELANMKKTVAPVTALHEQGIITSEQYEQSINALIDTKRFSDLVARDGEKQKHTAKFNTSSDTYELVEIMLEVMGDENGFNGLHY